MADPYASHSRGLESHATHHFAIAPANGVNMAIRPRALRVLTSGNLALRDEAGTILIYAVTAGEVLPFSAVGVELTGTTATVAGWY